MTDLIQNRPLSRANPHVRFIAQNEGPVRVLRCFHCRAKQILTFEHGVKVAAKLERVFINAHAGCPWPLERTRKQPDPYSLTQDKLGSILRWAARQEAS